MRKRPRWGDLVFLFDKCIVFFTFSAGIIGVHKMSNDLSEKSSRVKILESIHIDLVNKLQKLKDENSPEALKNYRGLVELINSTIRLEQAEKRFGVNLKIALLSVISSVLTSSIITILVQHLIRSNLHKQSQKRNYEIFSHICNNCGYFMHFM